MATILPFKRSADECDLRIRYYVLELACSRLGTAGKAHKVRKIIAQQIIKAMEKGEYDPVRLCSVGLAALGPMIIASSKESLVGSATVRALFPAA